MKKRAMSKEEVLRTLNKLANDYLVYSDETVALDYAIKAVEAYNEPEVELSNEVTQEITKTLPTQEKCGKKYTPVCPQGYTNCICDPAYIKCFYPKWYNDMYGDLTPQEAADKDCNVEDEDCYDDEDK